MRKAQALPQEQDSPVENRHAFWQLKYREEKKRKGGVLIVS